MIVMEWLLLKYIYMLATLVYYHLLNSRWWITDLNKSNTRMGFWIRVYRAIVGRKLKHHKMTCTGEIEWVNSIAHHFVLLRFPINDCTKFTYPEVHPCIWVVWFLYSPTRFKLIIIWKGWQYVYFNNNQLYDLNGVRLRAAKNKYLILDFEIKIWREIEKA